MVQCNLRIDQFTLSLIQQKSLFDIIQEKVPLGTKNSRGWYDCVCPVCNDHSARAGFISEAGFTTFSDWNCGAKFKYEEGSGKLSKNARQILEAFGITKADLTAIRSVLLQAPKEESEISFDELKKINLVTPEVPLPEKSHLIGADHHEELQIPIAEYLEKRKIDPVKVRAYFSLHPRYLNRVIIPYFRENKIIYWQARRIDEEKKNRYLNSPVARDAVMYGYDRLYDYDPAPLFVSEGVFDAMTLDGVCILGSSLNQAKCEVLKKSRRRIIFVIDRDRTGGSLAEQVLENGWELSFVDRRTADANDSVQRFGLPFTIYTLMKNATRNTTLSMLGVLEGRLGTYK